MHSVNEKSAMFLEGWEFMYWYTNHNTAHDLLAYFLLVSDVLRSLKEELYTASNGGWFSLLYEHAQFIRTKQQNKTTDIFVLLVLLIEHANYIYLVIIAKFVANHLPSLYKLYRDALHERIVICGIWYGRNFDGRPNLRFMAVVYGGRFNLDHRQQNHNNLHHMLKKLLTIFINLHNKRSENHVRLSDRAND